MLLGVGGVGGERAIGPSAVGHGMCGGPTWGIRIWIFLGEAQMEYNIIFLRIFNDIPFIGSRIFHVEAKSEYNFVFFSSPRVFPT